LHWLGSADTDIIGITSHRHSIGQIRKSDHGGEQKINEKLDITLSLSHTHRHTDTDTQIKSQQQTQSAQPSHSLYIYLRYLEIIQSKYVQKKFIVIKYMVWPPFSST
jgi:hypothetical protein